MTDTRPAQSDTPAPDAEAAPAPIPDRRAVFGLSARLLLLTIGFVMIAEFLIWAPSISRFRKSYLEETIARAHLAALALEAAKGGRVEKPLADTLLDHAGVYAIALEFPDRRMLALSRDMPPAVDLTLKLDGMPVLAWLPDAFATLFQEGNRVLRVMGDSPKQPEVMVEVVMDETPMRLAMYDYSTRILQLSVVISLITAGAVYVSLLWLLVRPMRRITMSMVRFQEDPEDAARIIAPSERADEVGLAERQLAGMQRDVRAALLQRARLATLGAAVAKINHDLRNSLATAMLVHDRLADLDDPEVKKVTPRLFTAIDHAVHLCSQTLSYVGDGTPKVCRRPVNLHALVDEVAETLRTFAEGDARQKALFDLAWANAVDPDLALMADSRQLTRAFENLARNSAEAGARTFTVRATREGGKVVIEAADDGPGLPAKARQRLFQPFAGAARSGGTGLGLIIVRDIVRAHGGETTLAKSDAAGAVFRLEIPDEPAGA